MKLSPKNYASLLINCAKEKNLSDLPKKFWTLLQKNKQYKDLNKIFEEVDRQIALDNSLVLVKIYSKEPVNDKNLSQISQKIEKLYKKKPMFKNIIKNNVTGIMLDVDGEIYDLTLENKINKIKKTIENQ